MTTLYVALDTIEGSAGAHHLLQGWTLTRVAVVTGLSGAGDTASRYVLALEAVIALVGDRGSPCLSIPVPTYLEEFIPEIISVDEVRVRIMYRGFPLPAIDFEGALSQVETNMNVNGEPIIVAYTYPKPYPEDLKMGGLNIHQNAIVQRPMPEAAFTVRFMVFGGSVPNQTIRGSTNSYAGQNLTATEVMTYLGAYVGCMNDAFYRIGLKGGDAHQWMITRVSGMSRNGGLTYEAAMTFQFRGGPGQVVGGGTAEIPGTPETPGDTSHWIEADGSRSETETGAPGETFQEGYDPIPGTPGTPATAGSAKTPYNWDKLAVFIAPATGLPPPDVIPGVGFKIVQVSPTASFPIFYFAGN